MISSNLGKDNKKWVLYASGWLYPGMKVRRHRTPCLHHEEKLRNSRDKETEGARSGIRSTGTCLVPA